MPVGNKPIITPVTVGPDQSAFADHFCQSFPELFDQITAIKWADGSSRETSSFSCFYEDGFFKVWLNERSTGRSVCKAGVTLWDALQAIERGLKGNSLEWRMPKGKGKK